MEANSSLRWLKQSGLESEETDHLKRVRKRDGKATFLLNISSSPSPPTTLPSDLQLPEPYAIQVPETAALTRTSLELKMSLWPTIFAPQRKNVASPWTRGKVRWARCAFEKVMEEAASAVDGGEVIVVPSCLKRSLEAEFLSSQLPIVAYVPILYEGDASLPIPFMARDTRISTRHPLRHAVLDVIRQVADYRTAISTRSSHDPSSLPTQPASEARNGANYLLTSLVVFTSHEPCIMCSMALLHSRVKEVFYAIPMGKTGGCGGSTCLPTLEGVNHRYGVYTWREGHPELDKIRIDEDIDA
jgi:tRNA-specific adenosine deaminase 3